MRRTPAVPLPRLSAHRRGFARRSPFFSGSSLEQIEQTLALPLDLSLRTRQVEGHLGLERGPAGLLFSTVHGELSPTTLAEWIIADRLPVRFQLQQHKVLWAPDARGV